MAVHVYYEQTPEEGDDFLEITDRVNLSNRNLKFTTNAEMASVGTNSFVIDDPDGDLELTGHRRIFIQEDECDDENELMFWGYLADRTVSRGSETPVGAARQWDVTITDINTMIGRRVMGGNDTDRPEEDDIERMTWMFGTSEAVNFTDNTTFVPSTPTVDMSDANYNGQYVQSIIDDCAQQSGRNYYVRWIYNADPAPHYEPAFWYAADTAALAISDLRISNVLEDLSEADTYAPAEDSTLSRDPSRVYAGVFGAYDGGWNYRTRPATTDEFVLRDTTANWPNIKKAARANARGDRYLDTLHIEEDVIQTSILVPPANVNDAHAGDAIEVRFSHFPGYEEFRVMRILSRTVTFVTPFVYQIDYTLTPSSTNPSCSAQIGSLQYDYQDHSAEAAHSSPIPWTPVAPDEPGMFVGCIYIANFGVNAIGTYTGSTGWTEVTDLPTGVNNTFAISGYAPVTDTPPTMSYSWSQIFPADLYGMMGLYLRTNATAPVQTCESTTSSPTFASTPTPGNIIVAFRPQRIGGMNGNPIGFTQVADTIHFIGTDGGDGFLDMFVRCVETGDPSQYDFNTSSFTFWIHAQEWALT